MITGRLMVISLKKTISVLLSASYQADERSFKQGTTTLDFFARLDAFIESLGL